MKLYKLTDQDWMTRNNTKWGPGVEHLAPGGERPLCTSAWLHAYKDPYVGLLVTPINADIKTPVLWLADGDVGADDGLKVGCSRLRTIKRQPVSVITIANRVAFGIYCALEIFSDPKFIVWAKAWLSGEDRSWAAAQAAEAARTAGAVWMAGASRAAAQAVALAWAKKYGANINFSELSRKALRVK